MRHLTVKAVMDYRDFFFLFHGSQSECVALVDVSCYNQGRQVAGRALFCLLH